MAQVSVSKEFMINKIDGYKAAIQDASDQVSEIIARARKEHRSALDSDEALLIRKSFHKLISNLGSIGGFCDNQTNGLINQLSFHLSTILFKQVIDTGDFYVLELIASYANRLTPNYDKTPFSFSAELKTLLGSFKTSYKKGK